MEIRQREASTARLFTVIVFSVKFFPGIFRQSAREGARKMFFSDLLNDNQMCHVVNIGTLQDTGPTVACRVEI